MYGDEGCSFFKSKRMVKIIYIEQVAEVIAHKCALWYYNENSELVEIPYEKSLDLTLREILNLMDRNNLYYNKSL
jgi:hypothetical protein